MRHLIVVLALIVVVVTGCQKAGEAALGAATGGQVQMNGGKIDIKGADGSVAHIDTNAGKMDVKGKDGATATMATGADGTATINTVAADGKVATTTLGGGTLPAGFPVTVPSGFKVVSVMQEGAGAARNMMVVTSGTGFDAAVAAMETESKKLGVPVQKSEMKTADLKTTNWSGSAGEKSATIVVMQGEGQDVNLSITLKGY